MGIIFKFLFISYTLLNLGDFYIAPRPVENGLLLTGSKFQGIYLLRFSDTTVSKIADGNAFSLRISSDGTKILFNNSDTVVLYDMNKGKISRFFSNRLLGYPVFLNDSSILIPNQGRAVLLTEDLNNVKEIYSFSYSYASSAQNLVAFQRNDSIFLFDLNKNQVKLLKGGDGIYYMPEISPDGRYISYSKLGEGIYVLNLNSGEQIFIGKGGNVSWHPSSKFLVFSLLLDDGHDITSGDLYVFDLERRIAIKFTETMDVYEHLPVFSLDGKGIYFSTIDGKIGVIQFEIK
ncbi:MAG: TolB family protein [Candidatus Hydrothermia bacterium]